jgi:hypothetical protein
VKEMHIFANGEKIFVTLTSAGAAKNLVALDLAATELWIELFGCNQITE